MLIAAVLSLTARLRLVGAAQPWVDFSNAQAVHIKDQLLYAITVMEADMSNKLV